MTDLLNEEKKPSSLSVIMQTFGKEVNIRNAYDAAMNALTIAGIEDYEFFLMTVAGGAGNTDSACEMAADIAAENTRVRHFHTPFLAGPGYKFREGVYAATKDYIIVISADESLEISSLVNILLHIDKSDILLMYPDSTKDGPCGKKLISEVYTALCNVLFGLDLKSYNNILAVRRDFLLKIPLSADDRSYLTEPIVYLTKSGVSFLELPQFVKKSETHENSILDLADVLKVVGSLGALFWKINIREECLVIPGMQPLPTASVGALVLGPHGEPSFAATLKLIRQNFSQTVHLLLVCGVKAMTRSLGLLEIEKTGIHTDQVSSFNKIVSSVTALVSVSYNVLTKFALTSINDVVSRKNSRRKLPRRKNKDSLSIIMPTFNESERLPQTCEMVDRIIGEAGINDYEIIIVTSTKPDGAHDGTLDVADNIAKNNQHIRHIRNESFAGIGFRFRQGVEIATKDFTMMIPGDGEFEEDSMAGVVANLGKAEVIIPYIDNPRARLPERQLMSQSFTSICNKLFGLNLRYYNGSCIFPTDYLKAVPAKCNNYAYLAEILIYLLKSGVSYKEVPFKIKPPVNSKAFKAESINEILEFLMSLFWKINIEGVRIDIK